MKKLLLIAFAIALLGELVSEVGGPAWLHVVFKPAIMVTLTGFYLLSVTVGARSTLVILGMLFSLVGDVLLMNESLFVPGLVAFLLAHILYILAYRQHQNEPDGRALTGVHRVRLSFPIVLAGTGLVIVLYPVLGDFRIPVIIYAAVITTMALTAMFRYSRTNASSFWLVFAGAVLFMISDSILAINKFLTPVVLAGFWIMLTYGVAQFLIVLGLLKHREGSNK